MSIISSSLQYNLINKGARAAVGSGTRFLTGKGWEMITKKKPPLNPVMPSVQWSEALAWGAVVGLVSGVLGIVARRLVAEAWTKYTGYKPEEPHG